MKHILVPTDFSECAGHALSAAQQLSKKFDSTIHLLHVYDSPISGLSVQFNVDDELLNKLHDQIQDELNRIAASDLLSGCNVELHLLPDARLSDAIGRDEFNEVDLVVMGSHGATGATERFIGSNAQKVVNQAQCPVLVIKDQLDISSINNVVFASNFFLEAETVFPQIKSVIDAMDATVHLLKVITPSDFENTSYSMRLMEDFANDMGLEDYSCNTYNDRDVELAINEFSNKMGADMVAIETHGRQGLGHFLFGSLGEHVVNHANLPVLITKIDRPEYNYGVIFPSLSAES